jgi:hypothetical protein
MRKTAVIVRIGQTAVDSQSAIQFTDGIVKSVFLQKGFAPAKVSSSVFRYNLGNIRNNGGTDSRVGVDFLRINNNHGAVCGNAGGTGRQ